MLALEGGAARGWPCSRADRWVRRPNREIGERRWLCHWQLQAGCPRAPRPRWAGPGRSAQAGWVGDARRSGAPAQAAAADLALRSRRRLQEEARWQPRRGGGEAEAAREDAPRLRRERYGAASRTRAQAATEWRGRGAPDGGRRRAVGRGCPGWPRPRGPGRIRQSLRGTRAARRVCAVEVRELSLRRRRPGVCRASAGLRGTAGGVGSSSPAGCPGARRLPGLARARLTKTRARWSSRFARKGCGGRPPAWRWRGCGAGERCADLLGLAPGANPAVPGPSASRVHRLLEESTGSGIARSCLGSTWPSLGETAGAEWKSPGLGIKRRSRKCVNGPHLFVFCYLCPFPLRGRSIRGLEGLPPLGFLGTVTILLCVPGTSYPACFENILCPPSHFTVSRFGFEPHPLPPFQPGTQFPSQGHPRKC